MPRFLKALLLAAALRAAPLDDAARDVAKRVAGALAPKESCAIQFRNPAQAPQADVTLVQRIFVQTIRPVNAEKTTEITVTLSQNPRTRLLVAEVRRGAETAVFISPYEAAMREKSALTVNRSMLWEQPDRILDAVLVDGGLLILDGSRIALTSIGIVRQQAAIPATKPWPRDLRGRLQVKGDQISANIADTLCKGTWRPEIKVSCEPGAADWPLAPGRNHFAPPKLPPSFSYARLDRAWITAGVDGKVRLISDNGNPLAQFPQWGASVAAQPNPCGEGSAVVASSANEQSIQAFDIGGGQAKSLSDPADIGGRIIELHDGGGALTAIVHSTGTQKHAAYRITLACSR